MRAILAGGFLAKVPRLTPAKVVALLAAMFGAVVALGLAASAASAETFSNQAPITINTATVPVPCPETLTTPATPYPSGIEVSALSGKVSDVNVTLSGLSHTWPDDVGVLLVGPEGQSIILMADSGGTGQFAVSGINLTFDDAAEFTVPDNGPLFNPQLSPSSTYKPDVGTDTSCPFPGPFPAPAVPYTSASLSEFNGTNPNGTWNLYVIDDTSGESGSISGGWSLTINTDTSAPSVTIDQASGQADPTTDSSIHFTAVFSEPVTDFTDSDVTRSSTAGATTADVTEIAPNDGTTYDVAVSGMITGGTVTASIPANAAQDAASNGNGASTSTDNTVTFIAPKVVSTSPRNGGEVGPTATITATFSENMYDESLFKAFKVYKKGSDTPILDYGMGYNAAKRKLFYWPLIPFKRGAIYKAVVSTEAMDVEGTRLDQNDSRAGSQKKVWFFEID